MNNPLAPLKLWSVLLFFIVLDAASTQAGTNSFPAHLAGRYTKRYTWPETYLFGADGRYTNVIWLCSQGNSRDLGRASLLQGTILLTPDDPREKEEPLVPVKWGERQYLIRASEMTNFCSAINLGAEPRDSYIGKFLMRENDWMIPVSGRPELPAHLAKYLLEKPLTGKVTEVIDQSSAWINLGREHGLEVGMELLGGNGSRLVVEQAYGRQSRVGVNRSDKLPGVGIVVTSVYSDGK
jgi:hypothetical protein